MRDARRMLPAGMHCATSNVWWRRDSSEAVCQGLGTLVPVKGNVNAASYKDILDKYMLPLLWPIGRAHV